MATIISPDHYRYNFQTGNYEFNKSREPWVRGRAYEDLYLLLQAGRTDLVVMMGIPGSGKTTWAQENGRGELFFDATNLTPERRAPIVALAATVSARVQLVFLDTDLTTCDERNDARPEDRRVPPEVTSAMAIKLVRPEMGEGFHQITVIRDGKVVENHGRFSGLTYTQKKCELKEKNDDWY